MEAPLPISSFLLAAGAMLREIVVYASPVVLEQVLHAPGNIQSLGLDASSVNKCFVPSHALLCKNI